MTVLAVDTSSEHASLALATERGVLHEVALPAKFYSTTLHQEIADLLSRARMPLQNLSGYAVTTGPGPFTGVRLGLTCVKGLAEAGGKAVIAISTLQALAWQGLGTGGVGPESVLVPILDAHRGQVFAAAFRAAEDSFETLICEMVGSLHSFLVQLQSSEIHNVQFCGSGMDRFEPEILGAGWGPESILPVPNHLAPALAKMGVERLKKGLAVAPAAVDANYVRPSDAELFWKE